MKSSGSSGSFKGFAFGEQQSLWIETFSKRKNQKNYYWNVDPNVNDRDRDEVISGYFTIDSKNAGLLFGKIPMTMPNSLARIV